MTVAVVTFPPMSFTIRSFSIDPRPVIRTDSILTADPLAVARAVDERALAQLGVLCLLVGAEDLALTASHLPAARAIHVAVRVEAGTLLGQLHDVRVAARVHEVAELAVVEHLHLLAVGAHRVAWESALLDLHDKGVHLELRPGVVAESWRASLGCVGRVGWVSSP